MRIGRGRKAAADEVVYQISDALKPLSEDVRSREAKYLMAMGVRVVAFVLVVILPIGWPWKLVLAALAMVLPYVAVVYANGGREPSRTQAVGYQDPYRKALLPGAGVPEPGGSPEPLVGRIVRDDDLGDRDDDGADDVGGGPGAGSGDDRAEGFDADVDRPSEPAGRDVGHVAGTGHGFGGHPADPGETEAGSAGAEDVAAGVGRTGGFAGDANGV